MIIPFSVECGNVSITTEENGGCWLTIIDDSGAEQTMAVEASELLLIQEAVSRWQDELGKEV